MPPNLLDLAPLANRWGRGRLSGRIPDRLGGRPVVGAEKAVAAQPVRSSTSCNAPRTGLEWTDVDYGESSRAPEEARFDALAGAGDSSRSECLTPQGLDGLELGAVGGREKKVMPCQALPRPRQEAAERAALGLSAGLHTALVAVLATRLCC